MSLCRFAYSPVAGDLKSGIPAEVDIPAPVRMTTFLATLMSFLRLSFALESSPFPDLMRSANLSMAESLAISTADLGGRGGVEEPAGVDLGRGSVFFSLVIRCKHEG